MDGRAHLTRVSSSAVVAHRVIHERINHSMEGSRQNRRHAQHDMNMLLPATLQCRQEKPSGSDKAAYVNFPSEAV